MTEIVGMEMYSKLLAGYSDTEITNALAQSIVIGGLMVDAKDDAAHTIVTREFPGQTLISNCIINGNTAQLNEYRSYTLRIIVKDSTVYINMGCRRSNGWEGQWTGGVWVPGHRSAIEACDPTHGYLSKLDSTIPSMIVEGATMMLQRH